MAIDPQKLEAVFEAARGRTAPERDAYLDEACEGDTELRASVDALLAAHDEAGTFLEPPEPAPVTPFMPSGTVVGRYKILESIGEGGYGTVFMAEQTSPVRRKVALKIIKAGMDTKQVIARFEAERQALALMDHPNIAKVFDAGTTDTGRPYFVMELVKGVPITTYCDEHRIDPRQRLELFMQVCQAVQHAHQKGIIHRDIKPTNVLLALYDGKPVPKVIDFGVAKATGQRLTEATMFTGFGDVIGTLEYMSPEQAELNQLDVDTRSDIYSLGVLLYELLTGSTPLAKERIKKTALLEALRFIREEEPPTPSTRLSTSEALPNIAASRGLEPKKLSGLVHGELDWIVMKALEKDRNRRYETANGFAMDLQRYLADEPVHACPPSATYRFRKFAGRNKVALLTVIVLIVALVGGTTVSTWQAIRATRATRAEQDALKIAKANEQAATASAKRADAERQRAEDTSYKARRAVSDVLANAAMGIGKWRGVPVAYRKIIAVDAIKYYESLMQTKNPDPAVRHETATALGYMGLMQRNFADYDQSEKLNRRACEIFDALVRDVPKPPEYRQQCAYRHLQLGLVLVHLDRASESQKEYRIAIALYEELLSQTPGRLNLCTELAECYKNLINVVAPSPEAQTIYQKLVACADAACRPFIAQPLTTRPADQAHREFVSLNDISSLLVNVPAGVSRDLQILIRMGRAMTALEPDSTTGWATLAKGHSFAGEWDAAQAALRKAADLSNKSYAQTPTASMLFKLAKTYCDLIEAMTTDDQPQLRLAEEVYGEALKVVSSAPAELRASPDVRRQIGHIYRLWALTLEGSDRMEEAEHVFSDAQSVFDKLVTDDPGLAGNWHFAADTRYRFANFVSARGRKQEAEQMLRRAIEIHELREAKFPNYNEPSRDRERAECYHRLGWILSTSHLPQQRDPVYAVKLAAKAVKIESDQSAFWTTLGIAKYRAGEWKDAIEALKKSTELHTTEVGGFNDLFLAMAHWQLSDKDESRRCYDRAIAFMEKNNPQDKRLKEFRAEAMELLGVEEVNGL